MSSDFDKLEHTVVGLERGGQVIVLDNGALIDSEAEAMLQALHSRSVGGLMHHLNILKAKGAGNFISNFYVGYGHKSIGDCGSTTVFIEGVSMLAAKAIQDSPLYSGQEASTRYIDFSGQPLIDPTQTEEGRKLLETQRSFYLDAQKPTREDLRHKYPIGDGEDSVVYEKAINARAFDITRSLLPAGASTNLAWHTNLRQAADKLLFLRHHPLPEVRKIAEGLEQALAVHHPNSFTHKRYEATEFYQDLIAADSFYHNPHASDTVTVCFDKIDFKEIEKHRKLFDQRPPKTELPKYLSQAGILDVQFQLDYGSFRDIQRHRALVQRMPFLTQDLGFNSWYVENLPGEIAGRLPDHLGNIKDGVAALNIFPEEQQYFLPMGYNTSNKFTGDLPATVYMVELRDSRFVHPTLQKVAHEIGRQIGDRLRIPLHVDSQPSRFDIGRGKHDIVLK